MLRLYLQGREGVDGVNPQGLGVLGALKPWDLVNFLKGNLESNNILDS
jgi:hypothetical protein